MISENDFKIKLMISEAISYRGMPWSYTASLIIDLFNEELEEITDGGIRIVKQDPTSEKLEIGIMWPMIEIPNPITRKRYENVTADYEDWRLNK